MVFPDLCVFFSTPERLDVSFVSQDTDKDRRADRSFDIPLDDPVHWDAGLFLLSREKLLSQALKSSTAKSDHSLSFNSRL